MFHTCLIDDLVGRGAHKRFSGTNRAVDRLPTDLAEVVAINRQGNRHGKLLRVAEERPEKQIPVIPAVGSKYPNDPDGTEKRLNLIPSKVPAVGWGRVILDEGFDARVEQLR